jgi:hypothetical protein
LVVAIVALQGREPRALPVVDPGLVDPLAQGLGPDAEPLGHPGDDAKPLVPLARGLEDDPNRALAQAGRVPPLKGAAAVILP